MNWWTHLVWGCALMTVVSRLCAADAPTHALPSLGAVLKGIVERAEADGRVEREFEARYAFVHAKTREEYNLKGKLKRRETQKLSFQPVVPHLPAKGLLERFINRMAGTVWVDETDFTVARLQLSLTEKLHVGGGVLGSVSVFEGWLERGRTEDGLWYTRRLDWRVECREFLVNKLIEQRETRDRVRKAKELEAEPKPVE